MCEIIINLLNAFKTSQQKWIPPYEVFLIQISDVKGTFKHESVTLSITILKATELI